MAILERPSSGGALGRRLGAPGLGVVAVTLVAVAALLPVVQSSNATTTGHDIRTLEAQRADLQASIAGAEADVAMLGAVERVNQQARDRLGMVPADRSLYLNSNETPPVAGVPARYLQQIPAPVHREPRSAWWQRAIERLAP